MNAFIVVFVVVLVMIAGTLITQNTDWSWYATLNKAPLNPPNYVFGYVWSALYLLIIISTILSANDSALFRTVFLVNMGLNLAWSYFFFGRQQPRQSLLVNILLILATGAQIYLSQTPISRVLLIPYLAWISFAAYLNYYIVANNTLV